MQWQIREGHDVQKCGTTLTTISSAMATKPLIGRVLSGRSARRYFQGTGYADSERILVYDYAC
jgi:hypothetical protein